MHRPIVICPLDIERRVALAAVGGRADVITSGPGPAGIAAAFESLGTHAAARQRLHILFGLCGGLERTACSPRITAVLNEQGQRWTAPVAVSGPEPTAVVLGVDSPAFTTDEKKLRRVQSGADVIDTESHSFASFASSLGWRWSIVRGVSDGPNTELPRQTEHWVNARGATRTARAIRDLVFHPSLLPQVLRLRRCSARALTAAAGILSRLITEELGENGNRS